MGSQSCSAELNSPKVTSLGPSPDSYRGREVLLYRKMKFKYLYVKLIDTYRVARHFRRAVPRTKRIYSPKFTNFTKQLHSTIT